MGREQANVQAFGAVEPDDVGAKNQGEWGEAADLQTGGRPSFDGGTEAILRQIEELQIPDTPPPLPGHTARTVVLIGLNRTLAAQFADAAHRRGFNRARS